jgi:dCTP deaminase
VILPIQEIRRRGILTPCCERTVKNGVSYGLTPAGYDLRIADDIVLWPGSSILVDAIERFDMPADVQGHLFVKSTWARMHLRQAGTVIDPGWHGVLRLEIDMIGGKEPLTIEAGTGVVTVVFYLLLAPTEQLYAGKYQNQRPLQDAIFENAPDSTY